MSSNFHLIIGLESSCDETSAAILQDGKNILSSFVSSQVELHGKYGGIVPELACRKHVEVINPLIQESLEEAGISWNDIGGIAVTNGPGLVGALLIGVAAAKAISAVTGLPLLGVNHLEGHIYANFLEHDDIEFPFLCLVVSGGHSSLILVEGHGDYDILGETRDDAAGEAFDKVARALNLGYPGGPVIDKMASDGNPQAVKFPRAYLEEGSLDFSFSGIKTAVINFLRSKEASKVTVNDICASFQQAVVDVLVDKTLYAAQQYNVKAIALAGGVASNSLLRSVLENEAGRNGFRFMRPSPELCTDNASMIACAGYYLFREGHRSDLALDVFPSLPLIRREFLKEF
ncbi:MAG: tRNA (adenosine(37)-N6)-threonylcarbamoyltransferase complex transferase subunit TsaD [Firmicutes bacterium]|nr:tRNA (adenosine(37)-N6)-threonylcarbamoyltransferase complex transferase subunit TsaD [Bacillota bacterium]